MISDAAATTALAARELADEDEDAITPRMTPLRETNGDIVVRLVTRNLEAAREYKQFLGVEAKARACARVGFRAAGEPTQHGGGSSPECAQTSPAVRTEATTSAASGPEYGDQCRPPRRAAARRPPRASMAAGRRTTGREQTSLPAERLRRVGKPEHAGEPHGDRRGRDTGSEQHARRHTCTGGVGWRRGRQ
jgi:hypothetical protein